MPGHDTAEMALASQQQQEQHDLPDGSRARFVVPHRQQQQAQLLESQPQPKTPLDLGLRSSPTIDDLLEGEASLAASLQQEHDDDGGQQGLPSLAGSPLEQPRPSQRLWLPKRSAPQHQQQQREQLPDLDLVSPAGPAFLQHQSQLQQEPGGVTPGVVPS